jgi:hypothetical protein
VVEQLNPAGVQQRQGLAKVVARQLLRHEVFNAVGLEPLSWPFGPRMTRMRISDDEEILSVSNMRDVIFSRSPQADTRMTDAERASSNLRKAEARAQRHQRKLDDYWEKQYRASRR